MESNNLTMEDSAEVYGTVETRKKGPEHNFCTLKSLHGGVYILNLRGKHQNKLSPASIQLIDESLDQVVKDKNACALITTNEGKFFSNGMDVNYLRNCDRHRACMFQRLISKFLTFCIPTLAVIRGHDVGDGCMLALAHDYRLMISSHGCIFMNEVDLGLALTPGNMDLLCSKLPLSTFQDAVLIGKQYKGEEASAAGIVHATSPMDSILLQKGMNKALEYRSRNWKREEYRALKMEMYKRTVQELEHGGPGYARM